LNLLLDTHVALWAAGGNSRLPERARDLIADSANGVAVSVVALWEIAIKHSKRGAPEMPLSAKEALQGFAEAGFELLTVKPAHVVSTEMLPDLHADPFDRMLVAQALTEGFRLVTSDKIVAKYDKSIILA
jgi:PIN domain nuclease of toxin-antitoxin system